MTGRKHRSDAGRRVALRLVSLRGEADRLERERDLMRIELAKILRAPGGSWRDPEAVRLSGCIRANLHEWQHVLDRMREEQAA